jgi:hypothetical protein
MKMQAFPERTKGSSISAKYDNSAIKLGNNTYKTHVHIYITT